MRIEKKEFREMRKELNEENKKIFEKIEIRLSSSNMRRDIYIETTRDLLGAILEGQRRHEYIEDILGKDLESFCDEIIENSISKTLLDKAIEVLYIIIGIVSASFLIIYIMDLIVGKNHYSAVSKINKLNMEVYLVDILILSGIGSIPAILNKFKYKFVFNKYEGLIKKASFIIEVYLIVLLNKISHNENSFSFNINIILVILIFITNYFTNKFYLNKQRDRRSYE